MKSTILDRKITIEQYLKEYGSSSLSFSSLQDGLQRHEQYGTGYIAFQRHRNFTFALSDPIADESERRSICQSFINRYDRPAFVHIGPKTAALLSGLGYQCNLMGYESFIELDNFNPTWRSHNAIKEANRRFKRAGIEVIESRVDQLDSFGISVSDMEKISTIWLSRKKHQGELSFLIRPLTFVDEPGVRYFFMFYKNSLVGFSTFDPIYRDGTVEAYCPNHARYDISRIPTGHSFYVNMIAVRKFQREGIKRLALGLSPLAGNLDSEYADSRLLKVMFRLAHKKMTWLGFSGLTLHKAQYKGWRQPVYYASARRGTDRLKELISLLRISGVI